MSEPFALPKLPPGNWVIIGEKQRKQRKIERLSKRIAKQLVKAGPEIATSVLMTLIFNGQLATTHDDIAVPVESDEISSTAQKLSDMFAHMAHDHSAFFKIAPCDLTAEA